MDSYEQPTTSAFGLPGPTDAPIVTSPTGAHSARIERPHRYRRPAIAAVLALALAGTIGGSAVAGDLPTLSLLSFGSASTLATNSATVASSVNGGVVDIVTTLGYQNAKAAGTGMILTSNGEILTNNHVVDGATSIEVTVVSTGKTYSASVVGTDPTEDVAVIQLSGASGLKTIPISSSAVKVGQKVSASGNAGGKGGTPSTVSGTVTALNQTITASDEGSSSGAEQLTGLIETNAPIEAGDSGGPLSVLGKVIGMDTAASTATATASSPLSSSQSQAPAQAYAIPIATALSIADQIEAGQASSTIHLGIHGFLGVELQDQNTSSDLGGFGGGGFYGGAGGYYSGGTGTATSAGAVIAGVVASSAASSAGLAAGDVITSVNGQTVDGATTLNTIMAGTKSGQKVSLGWTDVSGQSHTATVTLGAAAAD
jgi:S1-C subfamily serine protease